MGLVGGHHGLFDKLDVAELTDDGIIAETTTYKLVAPELTALPATVGVRARGRFVHVLDGQRWLQADLGNLAL